MDVLCSQFGNISVSNHEICTPNTKYIPPNLRYTKSYKQPSVGMILYSQTNTDIKYCLVKRRYGYGMKRILSVTFDDTTCFTEICNIERKALLYVCSMKEHWQHIHARLWRESMWNKDTSSFDYQTCLQKFINNRDIIKKMIKETKSIFPNGIWGFPKGHRERNENDMECAMREVKEETTVEDVSILSIPMVTENYKGWNYKYFVGITHNNNAKNINIDNPEISAVVWCSFQDALALIPKDAKDKRKLLKQIHNIVSN